MILHRDEYQSRQRLSFTFWPESRESQARNNLRNLLHLLRKALPEIDSFIRLEHATLKWKQGSAFTCDVENFEKAIAAARLLEDLILYPNSSLVYLAKAMLNEFNFEWENAEKAFQKTIELDPLNEIAHHELALLQMRLGRFEEAIESGKRAIYLVPNSFEYRSGLGEICLFQRDYEKAILEMNKAIQLNADNHSSHRWLAKVYMH